MNSFKTVLLMSVGALTSLAAPEACPAAVKATVEKSFAGSKQSSCKAEKKDGATQYEVKVARADGTAVEADVSPEGKLLQVEERIAVEKLPAVVAKAFASKYVKAQATKAEKQVVTDKGTFFEVAFLADGKKKEATFKEDGTFVDEE